MFNFNIFNHKESPPLIRPKLFFSSIAPAKLKENIFQKYNIPTTEYIIEQKFHIDFSVFELEDKFHLLVFTVQKADFSESPQVVSNSFQDPDSEPAKKFLLSLINCFEDFGKAVLVFDPKISYTLQEFKDFMGDWKKSIPEL